MFQPKCSPWRLGATATLLLGLASLGGCTVINAYEDPLIVGDWKRDIDEIDSGDVMSIDVDGSGKGVLFFTVTGETGVREGEFDIEWSHRAIDEFDLDWECDNDACGGLDFTLRCDINGDGDKLKCEDRSGVWTPPAGETRAQFDWVDD